MEGHHTAPFMRPRLTRLARGLGALTASLMLGACAQGGSSLLSSELAGNEPPQPAAQAAPVQNELERATEYWGKKFAENPSDLDAALSYAKNLKAMGQKRQALAVVQQAAVYHAQDKKLASEYGRLALELDQVSVAKELLALADDPAHPDWRVISARGTVLAKEAKYHDAIPFYERALTLSQDQPSVINNLAMAYTMSGDAAKAEALLRRVEDKGGTAKTRQNLALVLGLQGKYAEAQQIGSKDLGSETAAADTAYLKQMVRLEPQAPKAAPAATTQIAAGTDTPEIKPAVSDAAPAPFVTKVSQAEPSSSAPMFKPSAR